MTISPVAAPSAPPASGSPSSGGGAAGERFDALVRQHLSAGSDESAGSGSSAEANAAILEAASAPSVVRSDSLAALIAGMLAPAVSGTTDSAGVVSTPADAVDGAGVVSDAALAGDAALGVSAVSLAAAGVLGGPVITGVGVVGTAGPSSVDGSSDGKAGPGVAGVAAGTGPAGGEGAGALGADGTGPADGPAAELALASGTGTGTGTGDATVGNTANAAGSTGAGDAAGMNAAPAVAATSATGGTHAHGGGQSPAPEAMRGNPVTDQVFGQVTRLVSRGDGLHRLTLRLHPADLGEVKVVMTVKDGVVDVTLSAGAAAREALRDGSPQLRSLLELAGATTGQLVVRELSSTGSPAVAGSQNGNQPALQGQAGPGGEQEGSSNSGTAGDNPDARADGRNADRGNGPGGRGTGPGAARAVSDPDVAARHPSAPAGLDPLTRTRLDLDL